MTKQQHQQRYHAGATYAARQRLANNRNVEVSRIQAALIPVRTQKEVADLLHCSVQNIHQAERRILWKLITRMRELVGSKTV